jgi:hypothetical protein
MSYRQLRLGSIARCAPLFAVAMVAAAGSLAFGAPTPVTDCTTIKTPGTYQLTQAINASASGDCIVIKAGNVILNLHNFNLIGTTGSLAGIHVMPKAGNVFIEGDGANITGFTNGVEIEGANNSMEHLAAGGNSANGVWLHRATGANVARLFCDNNGIAGLLLDHSNRCRVIDVEAGSNGQYGMWLMGSSSNFIQLFQLDDNNVELYLGCSPTGPSGTKCNPGPQSSNNRIFGGIGGLAIWAPVFGLAIDLGSVGNRIIGNDFQNDTSQDLFDNNPNCGTNLWFANRFTKADPSCIN